MTCMTDATEHSVAARRRYVVGPRLRIPDEARMGRSIHLRDTRARWHLLDENDAPLCGRQANIGETTDYIGSIQSGGPLCDPCHGKYSWQAMPEYVEEDHGYLSPCWIWTRGPYEHVYGKRNHRNVHREAYEAAHGEIPFGYVIHHLCGETQCINPDHLEAMSRADHIRIHQPEVRA